MEYCKKHNQKYMDFLSSCPVCLGEKMTPAAKLVPKAPKTPIKRVKGPARIRFAVNDRPISRTKPNLIRVRA